MRSPIVISAHRPASGELREEAREKINASGRVVILGSRGRHAHYNRGTGKQTASAGPQAIWQRVSVVLKTALKFPIPQILTSALPSMTNSSVSSTCAPEGSRDRFYKLRVLLRRCYCGADFFFSKHSEKLSGSFRSNCEKRERMNLSR